MTAKSDHIVQYARFPACNSMYSQVKQSYCPVWPPACRHWQLVFLDRKGTSCTSTTISLWEVSPVPCRTAWPCNARGPAGGGGDARRGLLRVWGLGSPVEVLEPFLLWWVKGSRSNFSAHFGPSLRDRALAFYTAVVGCWQWPAPQCSAVNWAEGEQGSQKAASTQDTRFKGESS